MTVQAELAALQQASQLIAQIRGDIGEEQAKLRQQVDDLLAARWEGEAAAQFSTAWHDWCTGMADVLSGLGLESAAIELTRAELGGTDAERAAAAQKLHARLGEGA